MPYTTAIGDFGFVVRAALGASWIGWVGDEADLTLSDPVATETVRVYPAAGELEVVAPGGVFAAVRVEEGTVHGGEVELAEARAGWREKGGRAWVWLGRWDVPVTLDRQWEAEELGLAWRPVLSRTSLPLHAVGLGAGTELARRVRLDAGLMYPAANSDAPWGWARLDVTPLGTRPEDSESSSPRPALVLGIGASGLDSPSLGQQWLLSADVDFRWRLLAIEAGVVAYGRDTVADEVFLAVATRIARFHGGSDLHLRVRGEAARHLAEHEDLRILVEPRLSWRSAERHFMVYVEGFGSFEQGTPVDEGEDVVDAGRGIERSNGAALAGLQVRL